MVEVFGDRQQDLLKLLLKKRQGLKIEQISEELGITRPATRAHLVALERLGYVERGELVASGGRPSQSYRLSQKGYDLDRKSTRLNSSHVEISYAVFCLKKKIKYRAYLEP